MTKVDRAVRIFAHLALTIVAIIGPASFAPAVAQQSNNPPQADIAFQPHPTAKISEAQWAAYFQQVKTTHRKSMVEFPEQKLAVFDSADTYYAFTQPGHPAHPAWITRKLVVGPDGQLNMNQIGYFAGEEPAFAKLYQQYQLLTQKAIEEMKARRGLK